MTIGFTLPEMKQKKQTEKASLDGLERQTEISVKIQTYLTEEQL
jgi:hypothetical protein